MKHLLILLLCSFILISAGNKLEEGMSVPKFFVRIYNESNSGYSLIKSEDLFNGKNKAVVVSFFASYCKPCKKEIFVLDEFYRKYKEKGVMILEISIDTEANGIEFFKKIVDDTNISMPCVLDSMGVVSRRFGVDKLPTLFVFDKYGYVKKKFEGYTEENVSNFEKVVLELIDEKEKVDDTTSNSRSDKKINDNAKNKEKSQKEK